MKRVSMNLTVVLTYFCLINCAELDTRVGIELENSQDNVIELIPDTEVSKSRPDSNQRRKNLIIKRIDIRSRRFIKQQNLAILLEMMAYIDFELYYFEYGMNETLRVEYINNKIIDKVNALFKEYREVNSDSKEIKTNGEYYRMCEKVRKRIREEIERDGIELMKYRDELKDTHNK
ncbi:hypothetical protein ECANGB1_2083 [Enterospora canceri]|uniref:Uncharacterized protein n=1 Tax=Enterospora canceri TaxID=1081671 RepID=A0A1Y1S8R7_9MICR|nr:hypothetical protein ECANGB1_2083 [Enterospora canceri]